MKHGGPPDLVRHASELRSRTADDSPKPENVLHEALLTGRMTLYWQLIVHCPTRRLQRLKAVARWDKRGVSLMFPAIFVPIAKTIGQHRKLAPWFLRHALAQAARWPGHMLAAVNVSTPCFREPGLSRAVLTIGAADMQQ